MVNTETKTERQELELKVHHALRELSDHFMKREDPLQYEVNRLWRDFDRLRTIPDFPKPPTKGGDC